MLYCTEPNLGGLIAIIIAIVVVMFLYVGFLASRYKKCPSDKIMVIYGSVGKNADGTARTSRCIHGGAAFVWPFLQAYKFLDLTPMLISIDFKNVKTRDKVRIDVPSRFTVGVSTEAGVMQNAAERLLGIPVTDIQELAKDIILGQLRIVISLMDVEEIEDDHERFLHSVSSNIETEFRKIGLRLINVNMTDIIVKD